ncbi:glycosyltransferase WbpZ [Synergistales bacterium]|nr:glycosyltransferase WbpZ [Synergistales bacterium]
MVRQIATHMARLGHEPCVLCFGSRNVSEELEGVQVRRVAPFARVGSAPVGLSFIREFRRLAARADVINIHSPNPMGEVSALLFGKNKKIVCTYHGDAQRPGFLLPGYDLLMRRFFSVCAAVTASSPKLAVHSRVLPSAASKITIVPLGIPIEKYDRLPPDRFAVFPPPRGGREVYITHGLSSPSSEGDVAYRRQGESFCSDPFTVMFAGRLVYYKGVFVLIEALSRLKKAGEDVSALIVGSGPLEKEIKDAIISEQLENCVTVLPHQPDDIYRAMFARADCFALPSTHKTEAYGIAILEAMASGLPVISTELGTGTSWVNENGRTGLVVPPGDPCALSEAIKYLAKHTEERKKMGASALVRAREAFDEKTMLKAYEELFFGHEK